MLTSPVWWSCDEPSSDRWLIEVAKWFGARRAIGDDPLVMLVASSGGHLSHLLELKDFWGAHRRVWVSFDVPDVTSRLVGEEVTWAYRPTTRNLRNLVRNLGLAWSELRRLRPDLIVSTGAGVAVPFFWLGRLLGARTAYLEVYDRIDSATVTGRLVRRFTDAMWVQWPEQASLYPNAKVMGTIWPDSLDDAVVPANEVDECAGEVGAPGTVSSAPGAPLIVVTVGTDFHSFDRLVAWAARWADDHATDARMVIQLGTARDPGGAAKRIDGALGSAELLALINEADAVVCGAGPGTVIDALRAGVQPVVVPRRGGLDEAVDDHQVAFAALLSERSMVRTATSEAELHAHLDQLLAQPGLFAVPPLTSSISPGAANLSRALEAMLT